MTAFNFVTMTIHIEHTIPVFLEKEKVERSDIWSKNNVFKAGEKIHIVAPSGSGKTSLIHFLYGLRRDFEGNILFNNKNIAALKVSFFGPFYAAYNVIALDENYQYALIAGKDLDYL